MTDHHLRTGTAQGPHWVWPAWWALLLGLVAEMPRHGYELEQVIDQRSMREWSQIGFSSIYFVLGKLEARGLIAAGREASSGSKSRKVYSISGAKRLKLRRETHAALSIRSVSCDRRANGWREPSITWRPSRGSNERRNHG
jgi:DNA-binding PadR family transcriptional regulator